MDHLFGTGCGPSGTGCGPSVWDRVRTTCLGQGVGTAQVVVHGLSVSGINQELGERSGVLVKLR